MVRNLGRKIQQSIQFLCDSNTWDCYYRDEQRPSATQIQELRLLFPHPLRDPTSVPATLPPATSPSGSGVFASEASGFPKGEPATAGSQLGVGH